jgi:hypothetical protein
MSVNPSAVIASAATQSSGSAHSVKLDCRVASLLAMTKKFHSAVIARLDRAIQYAAACPSRSRPLEYWIPAFAGMTAVVASRTGMTMVTISRTAMPTN